MDFKTKTMNGQVYTEKTLLYIRDSVPVFLTFLLSLVLGGLLSYDLILFGSVLLGAAVVIFAVLKPKYMIYFVLFSSSVLSYFALARYTTFLKGTGYEINLQGLRNMLIIVVTIPLIFFNIGRVVRAKFFFPILLYILSYTVLLAVNFSMDGVRLYTNIISPYLFYFLILIFIRDEKDKKAVLTAIIFSSFIPIIVGVLQFLDILPIFEKYDYHTIGKRIHSTFDLANTFGVYMVMFSSISILKFIHEQGSLRKTWNAIYMVGAHLALLLPLSRNAIFSMLTAYTLIANAKWGMFRSLLVALLLILILFSVPGLNERLLVPSQRSGVSIFDLFSKLDYTTLNLYSMNRLDIWTDWWKEIKESTLTQHILGHGFDYAFVKGRYFHNEFLRTFWVNGIVGLLFYMYVISYIIHRIYKWMKESLKRGEWNIYYISAFSYIFAMVFMLNFDNIMEKHQIWVYFFALLSLAEMTRTEEKEDQARNTAIG